MHVRWISGWAADWADYHPPWRDGAVEYGPTSPSAYERALESYAQSYRGGGLWDAAEDARSRGLQPAHRLGELEVHAWLERGAPGLSARQAQIASWWWRDGRSVEDIARLARCSGAAVRQVTDRVRRHLGIGRR